jgi:hypothetical protein
MFGPFPIADVIARLTATVPALRLVGNAADLQAALKTPPLTTPAAFVLGAEKGDVPRGDTGRLVQMIQVAVQVVLWVSNYAGGGGGSGARTEMDSLQTLVRTALINWTPDADAFDVLNFQADRDESFAAGNLISQTIFRTRYRLTSDGPL